jgi:hypothetical protein
MHTQPLFKQGATSDRAAALLARVQSTDPGSPDINEDNVCHGWGHYQFMAGDFNLSSCLTVTVGQL